MLNSYQDKIGEHLRYKPPVSVQLGTENLKCKSKRINIKMEIVEGISASFIRLWNWKPSQISLIKGGFKEALERPDMPTSQNC